MPRRNTLLLVTGNAQLDANMRQLAGPAQDRASRSAIRAGMSVLARAIRAAAPKGKTGALKASIGSRIAGKSLRGIFAKAGINVGRKPQPFRVVNLPAPPVAKKGQSRAGLKARKLIQSRAPHSHLVALGTRQRKRKRIGGRFAFVEARRGRRINRSTGKMPRNDFVRRATQSSRAAVIAAIETALGRAIGREVDRIGRKTGQAVNVH